MPVAISYAPVPSRSTLTRMAVSVVLRSIVPVRMSRAIRARIHGASIVGAAPCPLHLTHAEGRATCGIDMSDDTPDSLIPYDDIVQEALRAVVGRVLGEIVDGGGELPGNHHFYITFKTHAPGVSIPKALRERFPDEMTIVLQNNVLGSGRGR